MNSAAYGIQDEIFNRRLSRAFIVAVPPVCQDSFGESTAYVVVDYMGSAAGSRIATEAVPNTKS